MDTKVCTKCGVEKDLEEFYAKSPAKVTYSVCYSADCKPCTCLIRRNYRKEKRDIVLRTERKRAETEHRKKYREQYRERLDIKEHNKKYRQSAKGKEISKKTTALQRIKYPYKIIARAAVNNALKAGKIQKEPCVVCGDQNSHGHHEDYSKHLELVWYCPKHHMQRHAWLREVGLSWDMTGKPIFPSKDRADTDKGLLLDGHV